MTFDKIKLSNIIFAIYINHPLIAFPFAYVIVILSTVETDCFTSEYPIREVKCFYEEIFERTPSNESVLSIWLERGFSRMARVKSDFRSQLSRSRLSACFRMSEFSGFVSVGEKFPSSVSKVFWMQVISEKTTVGKSVSRSLVLEKNPKFPPSGRTLSVQRF